MPALYQRDLACIQAAAFGGMARGAAPELVRRLRSAAIPVHRVVDAGCGAGPLAQVLAAEGFAVTGIDASAELLAHARRAVPAAEFVHASLYDAVLPPCEAIAAVGEPLTYHQAGTDADAAVHGFFERAAAALPAGGLLFFDVIEAAGETGVPSLDARSWMAGDDWAVLVETVEDAAARSLARHIETFLRDGDYYRRGREVHHVRLFDAAELTRKLSACGFAVETARSYGTFALPPRRRAFFAARR